MPTAPLPYWLTKRQVCELTKLSRSTIERAMRDGELRYVKVGTRLVRFEPEWVDEWFERRGRPPEGPINPDALASRVNIADPHGHQVTGGELRQWLVDAGYAEQDQFGRIVLKPDARRLVSQAFG